MLFNWKLISGAALLWLCSMGVQEVRLMYLRHEITQSRTDQREAEQALADYQTAATRELARRLLENVALETKRQKELDDARQSYQNRVDAINARWMRDASPAASRDKRAVPATALSGARAVDGAANSNQLPRCVRADRRSEFEHLLREADINTAKLLECQGRAH